MTRLPLRGTSQAAGTVFLSESLLLSLLCFLKFLIYPLDALRPRRAPTFWPAESRQRLAKEGCAPFGIPPAVALARPSAAIRARGVTELLAACAAGASAQICEGVAAKAKTNAVPCAGAHDRRAFPFGERRGPGGVSPQTRMTGRRSLTGNLGGQGGVSPHPEAVEVQRPWRARRRSRPSPTAPKLQPRKRRGVRLNLPRQRGLGGFQRGASSTPLWSGDSQGGETPLRQSLPTFCWPESRGPARPERVEGKNYNFK